MIKLYFSIDESIFSRTSNPIRIQLAQSVSSLHRAESKARLVLDRVDIHSIQQVTAAGRDESRVGRVLSRQRRVLVQDRPGHTQDVQGSSTRDGLYTHCAILDQAARGHKRHSAVQIDRLDSHQHRRHLFDF